MKSFCRVLLDLRMKSYTRDLVSKFLAEQFSLLLELNKLRHEL
ncbi:MAG: hypothetical protein K0S74_1191 [Chlamydiales bacterium]|jgi:hypothetical protein|nr:hypothetical protein [Chlamydiales bacterium]